MISGAHFQAVLQRSMRKAFELKGAREWAQIEGLDPTAYLLFLARVITGLQETEFEEDVPEQAKLYLALQIAFEAGWDLRGELEAAKR